MTLEDDVEVYSDPDEGVVIVDMENVRTMDWMAPESLRRERERSRKTTSIVKTEEDGPTKLHKGKTMMQPSNRKLTPSLTYLTSDVSNLDPMDIDDNTPIPEDVGGVNLANALDLSETEDEEEMEDLVDDFSIHNEPDEVSVICPSFRICS